MGTFHQLRDPDDIFGDFLSSGAYIFSTELDLACSAQKVNFRES